MEEEQAKLIWVTGLPATGKTTIARELYKEIKKKYPNTVHLDGDDMRNIWGIWAEKSPEGRRKMSMSYAKMCELLTHHGINVIMSTVALFHDVQEYNRKKNKEYYEILVETNNDILDIRHGENIPPNAEKVRWKEEAHEFPKNPDLILLNNTENHKKENVHKILKMINF